MTDADTIRALEAAVRDRDARLAVVCEAARALLAKVYPAAVFTGESGDEGARLVVELRGALASRGFDFDAAVRVIAVALDDGSPLSGGARSAMRSSDAHGSGEFESDARAMLTAALRAGAGGGART